MFSYKLECLLFSITSTSVVNKAGLTIVGSLKVLHSMGRLLSLPKIYHDKKDEHLMLPTHFHTEIIKKFIVPASRFFPNGKEI